MKAFTPHHPRVDKKTSELIDNAIVINGTAGAAIAWAFLQKYGISTAVILRVLSGGENVRVALRFEEVRDAKI